MNDPVTFINEHLHRFITPTNILGIAEIAPEELRDAMLQMGSEFYQAHIEDRPYEFRMRYWGLSGVVDVVEIDPGSDFGLGLVRLWLHTEACKNPK